ncbi:MAG TPA: hypothetical protein VL501_01790 [Pyrinomonadaceae bacterium]|nr:hypothetical protein [Pyrinomonadaceae bacterium]
MDQQQIQQFVREYWAYILAANFVIGIILGLIPFFVGRRKGQKGLGLAGLIATPIVCLPSTLLGIVCALAFTIIILIKSKGNTNGSTDGE